MTLQAACAVALIALVGGPSSSVQPAIDDLIDRASQYVVGYEGRFRILALDEEHVQWIERPNNPGGNLSRANPGGGILTGGERGRKMLKSDYLLLQLGEGRGWMPFRDPVLVDGKEMRSQDDRLVRLFQSGNPDAFELATKLHDDSRRHDLGQVARTINIPMLGMMLVHPQVRERFQFRHDGDESIAGRLVERLSFKETARPTLTRTSRGRDLALTGRLWIEPSTGVIVKTETIAADPAVRAVITVTFRREGELSLWVPERMEEYYKANLALDDVFAVSTYSAPRVFQGKD